MIKSWMDTDRPRGERAYWMRQRTRVTWKRVACRLGYLSIEGARSGAERFAHREKLTWPVLLLSRGAICYSAYSMGESWLDIGLDFGMLPCRAQNAARGWAHTNMKPWPPRSRESWEKGRRRC